MPESVAEVYLSALVTEIRQQNRLIAENNRLVSELLRQGRRERDDIEAADWWRGDRDEAEAG